ncbi:MAG: UDP-N-acetylmuramoyl-L-alanyl-D-glutamate--2,6-diaminopimelate ligase [Proteobacteria bacterium]|nr:UDP-N-acetylmuramoyl-L-alanyl-D-glutamate--2,6-diaminopimelate ligase [Pseudomonadota bacterium]
MVQIRNKKLSELGLTALNGGDVQVMGLASDSRSVKKGYLFAALSGQNVHGAKYVSQAIDAGAVAILTDKEGYKLNGTYLRQKTVAIIVVEDSRQTLSYVAALWFGSQPGTMTAVTGTNGKTSVSSFTCQIWEALGFKAVNIGTNGVQGVITRFVAQTTPDPIILHGLLSELFQLGVTHAAMEASSHGLDQRRLDGVGLMAAGFTNLSQDHLDYHIDLDTYFLAKMDLFIRVLMHGGTAVINMDDVWGKKVLTITKNQGIRSFTIGKKMDCDLRLINQKFVTNGQDLRFSHQGKEYQVKLELIGNFQGSNVLIAAGLAIASGCNPSKVFGCLSGLKTVSGRMELVACRKNGGAIFVDYAHTPDAIEVALKAIRLHALGRVLIVFGSGGDRDKTKRILMGAAAEKWADKIFITDDNPRSEDPREIRSMVKLGAPKACEVPDRAEAILRAISELANGDVLLIAGKGHETGQIIGDDVLPFNDSEQASISVAALDGII